MNINQSNISTKKVYFLISILIFLIYGNAINNEYSLDDDLVVYKNQSIEKGLASVKSIFVAHTIKGENTIYRPLPLLTFAIEKQFFSSLPKYQTLKEKKRNDKLTQANISHFINVVLYILTCILLYNVLKVVFVEYNLLVPITIVLLFLIHPLHTEPVNNLKSRDELLMLIFVLLAIQQAIKFCLKTNYYRLVLIIVFFLLARLSKENAIALIGLMPVFLYFLKVDIRKLITVLSICLLAIVSYYVFKKNTLETSGLREYLFFENPLFYQGTIIDRITVGLYCSWFYLKMLIYPLKMSFYYGYNQIPMANFSYWQVWCAILFFIPVGIYGFIQFLKRNILGLGIVIWFGVMLGVINVFFPIVGIVADRFAYLFSLGYCIVLTWVLFTVFKLPLKNNSNVIKLPNSLLVVFLSIATIYSSRVIARNFNWHDHMSLYNNDIQHLTESAKAHALIANTLYPSVMEKAMQKQNNQALKNDIDKLIFHYQESIRIDSTYLKSLNNLGSVYSILKKDYNKAIYYSEKAVELDSNYFEAHFNLGYSYDAKNEYENAIYHYLKVIEINPDYNNTYIKLELLLNRFNKFDDGILRMEAITKKSHNPKNIYLNIANFFAKKGEANIDKALIYFEKAFYADTTNNVICSHIIKLYEMKQDSVKVKYYTSFLK